MPRAPIQIKRNSKPQKDCGHCGTLDSLTEQFQEHEMVVADANLFVSVPRTVCGHCGVATASFEQADKAVAIAVSAYQTMHGLITGTAARERRKAAKMTQKELEKSSKVSIASIKRLESGVHVLNDLQNDAIVRILEQSEKDWANQDSEDLFTLEWTVPTFICSGWATEPEIVADHSLDSMALGDGAEYQTCYEDSPMALAC